MQVPYVLQYNILLKHKNLSLKVQKNNNLWQKNHGSVANKYIVPKTNIGNHVDSVEEDLWYELGIKCYRWGESRLRGHILRLIAVKGTDIWIELLYGLKTDEWGYSYELIDGIAAEDGSTAFKEFKRKYFFPNGRKPNARKPAADVVAEESIHIKDENKGKFNATKERTGKSTEELTHSKNPVTRKRAIFAQNAKKWNKK